MPRASISPRIRVRRGEEIAFGPGKADLLVLVAETGSLRKAAERMDMSYMRAWKLVQTMNRCYRQPLVRAERGGATGGGAQLTDFGREVLALYREMESASMAAIDSPWGRMRKLLRAK